MRDEGFRRENGQAGVTMVLLGCAVALMLVLGGCSISCVGTGNRGVVTTFGEVTGKTVPEGINIVTPPWAFVHPVSIRTQELKEHAEVPSSEGLIMTMETSLLYRVKPECVAQLYQTVGNDYVNVVLTPNLRSAIRAVTAAHKASDLYSTAREKVAEEIRTDVQRTTESRCIVAESVLLRDLQLPPTLKTSIEEKQKADQEAQRMTFVLQRETQEAERKRVEAAGIRDFQAIVTAGISDKLLEWKGIEATEKLVNSPNTKVVVIGNPKNGLPLILGGGTQ